MSKYYLHDKNVEYPRNSFEHMIKAEKYHDYKYDATFPYRLSSLKDRFIRFIYKLGFVVLVQPVCAIRYALKFKGLKNIRKYHKMSHSKALLSVCNHTTEWDIIMIMTSRYFSFPEFPIWQEGAESKSGMMYRYAGGLVLPYNSFRGTVYSYKAMKDVLDEGKWLHVFPEAACWAFYPCVRKFKDGTFLLAYDTHLPILPMVVKYRPAKGIYKLFKKHPCATLIIGEPLECNFDLPRKEAAEDLKNRVHLSMVKLLSFESEEENAKAIEEIYKKHN